jgi:hypothetical protein
MELITKESIIEKLKYYDDPDFKFDEPSHVYTYKGKVIYGVTSFLERFIKKFDSDYWSKKKADEEGIPQSEMLARWDAKRDRSCDLGHCVHDYIERFYEENNSELTEDPEANERIAKFHLIYESRLKTLESVGSEIRVLSKKWGLAGTIDKLYLFENSIIVGDWKTNAKIKTDKDFAFGKLLFPFEKYKENEINKYSLQISLYQLLLEEAGIYSDYGFICHIPSEGEAKIYKLKDFRAELRTYMNHQFLNETPDEKVIKELAKVTKLW